MKPSDLKKDGRFSGRINKEVMTKLKSLGITPQMIIDAHIDGVFEVETKVRLKNESRNRKRN